MIRMESDLNTTAGAKSAAQALKMDVNAYTALFLQVSTQYQLLYMHKCLDLTMATVLKGIHIKQHSIL